MAWPMLFSISHHTVFIDSVYNLLIKRWKWSGATITANVAIRWHSPNVSNVNNLTKSIAFIIIATEKKKQNVIRNTVDGKADAQNEEKTCTRHIMAKIMFQNLWILLRSHRNKRSSSHTAQRAINHSVCSLTLISFGIVSLRKMVLNSGMVFVAHTQFHTEQKRAREIAKYLSYFGFSA